MYISDAPEGHMLYKKMDTLTHGLSQGDFSLLRVLYNGTMTDITTLISGGGGGGTVTSANAPLSIKSNVLTVDLNNIMNTSHEVNKIPVLKILRFCNQ